MIEPILRIGFSPTRPFPPAPSEEHCDRVWLGGWP
eukprot:COSAG06_NODE_59160_length_275_cov_0.579545_1_plen_34_part_10